jgi:NADH-quinone oxidoreductase subunit A
LRICEKYAIISPVCGCVGKGLEFSVSTLSLPSGEKYVIIISACDSINEGVGALLNQYVFIGIFVIVAIAFPIIALALAFVIRPKKPNPVKSSTYECGLETIGETWVQFRVQYYIYALVFVIFDVETVFLYPWAVAYNKLGLFALVEMFIFLGILVGGLIYAWRKGALEWV